MRYSHGTHRPVVPVIVDIVVVHVRKTSVVRVATIEAVRSVPENLSVLANYHCPLITLGTVFYLKAVAEATSFLKTDKEFLFFNGNALKP